MKVNIIIPVHNRPDMTRQTIESLYKNTIGELFDLWVIDDASEKETKAVLSDLRVKYKFNHHTQFKNIGPGASRNGITRIITKEKKRGDYLYHSDNDVYFKEGWLKKLIKAYETVNDFVGLTDDPTKILLMGGGCHPYLKNNSAIEIKSIKYPGQTDCVIGIKDAVSGYSQLMTWGTWDKYGPFDESMRGQEKKIMGSEDYAFCQKIIKDGFKVGAIEPEVVVACGKTNTYGKLATGHETFEDHEGVIVK